MYNCVEDSGRGDPMFYELTDDEIRLHDEKNQDYRSTSNPVANFDRVAAWMALYPDIDWARPEMVAILYAQKQIDSAMSLMERGMEGGVETIDTRARDVHIYWKLFRVIRRKHVEAQSRAGPIRMAQDTLGIPRHPPRFWNADECEEVARNAGELARVALKKKRELEGVCECNQHYASDPCPLTLESKPRTLWQRFLRRIGL